MPAQRLSRITTDHQGQWETLKNSVQGAVGVTLGTMNDPKAEGVPKDDPYPISVKKFEKLSPLLATVDEEPLTKTESGNEEEAHQ